MPVLDKDRVVGMVTVDRIVSRETLNADNFGAAIDVLMESMPAMDPKGRIAALLAVSDAAEVGIRKCAAMQLDAEGKGYSEFAGAAYYVGAGFMEIVRQCCFEAFGRRTVNLEHLAGLRILYDELVREYQVIQ